MAFKTSIFLTIFFPVFLFIGTAFASADPVNNSNCPMNNWVFEPSDQYEVPRGDDDFYELTFKEDRHFVPDGSPHGETQKKIIAQIYIKAYDLKTEKLRATLHFEYACNYGEACDAFYKGTHLNFSELNPNMTIHSDHQEEPTKPDYLIFRSISDRIFKKKFPPLSDEDATLFYHFSKDQFPATAETLALWRFEECRTANSAKRHKAVMPRNLSPDKSVGSSWLLETPKKGLKSWLQLPPAITRP